jgi:hypothetical protein
MKRSSIRTELFGSRAARLITWVLFAALFLTSLATAQVSTGTIAGAVRDTSGAVVPRATVTLKSVRTNVSRTETSSNSGDFSFPQLDFGEYDLSVEAQGFAVWQQSSIRLHVAETLTVNPTLSVGALSEKVTVTAPAFAVSTQSTEVGSLVTPQQMTEIPLNGRNFLQLLTLQPGMSASQQLDTRQTGALGVTAISAHGAPDNFNMFTVDGVNNVSPDGGNILITYPTIDSIEEFRVQTSNYSPQYGQAAGAQITMVTKSGTNNFHGTLYEFLRNDKLDANDFFLNQAGKPKPELRYNNFGYTVGGPIRKDKIFFFWSEEWRRQRRGLSRGAHVPSAPEKIGDFSQDAARYNLAQCYTSSPNPGAVGGFVTTQGGCGTFPKNPNTGTLLGFVAAGQPLNPDLAKIPASQLSPAGLTFLKLYPDPTVNPFSVRNWVASPVAPVDSRQETLRLDYQITPTLSIMARGTNDNWKNDSPSFSNPAEGLLWGDDIFPNVSSNWSQPGKTGAIRLSKTSANMVNSFQYSYSTGGVKIEPGTGYAELSNPARAAIPLFFPKSGVIPHTTYWSSAYQQLFHNVPYENQSEGNTWQDDFSKVIGTHTIIAGALFSYNKKRNPVGGSLVAVPGEIYGASGFGNQFGSTGAAAADFLFKGMAFNFDESSAQSILKNRYHDFEWYLGDTWKVRPNLTINYGFRWSFFRTPYAADDNFANFVPSLWTPANARSPLDGLAFPGKDGYNRGLVNNVNTNVAPRLGIAWDPHGDGKMAIRAGFGQSYHRTEIGQQVQLMGLNPPFVQTLAGRMLLDPVNGQAFGYDNSGNPISTSQAGVGFPSKGIDPNMKTPYGLQWNFAIERQLFRNQVLTVSYVGSRAVHEPYPTDINQVPAASRARCVAALISFAGCGALRPYGSGVIGNNYIWYQNWSGNSSYHGLLSQFKSQFGRGSQVQLSYTWSKQIGDIGLVDYGSSSSVGAWQTDLNNPRLDRGPSVFDRPHIFVANYIYHLPMLSSWQPVARSILGQWEVSGVVNISSGPAFTVLSQPNIDYSGVGFSLIRPDLVAGASTEGPKTVTQWFNTSAFTLANHVVGTPGNAGRGIVRGPATDNADFSAMKNWQIPWFKSGDNARVQFRGEFFNIFNHTQPLNLNTSMGAFNIQFDNPANPTRVVSYSVNPAFGAVTRMRAPRELEFGLKLIW